MKLRNRKQDNFISLSPEEYLEYLDTLKTLNRLSFSDEFSKGLRNINYLMFLTEGISEIIESALTKNVSYMFTKELIETVLNYTMVKFNDYCIIDIIRQQTEIEFEGLKKLYPNVYTIFFTDKKLKDFLEDDYLLAIYVAIKYKLYRKGE